MPSKMAALTGKASEAEKEQNEQVWKAFTQLLEQVETIFWGRNSVSGRLFVHFAFRNVGL